MQRSGDRDIRKAIRQELQTLTESPLSAAAGPSTLSPAAPKTSEGQSLAEVSRLLEAGCRTIQTHVSVDTDAAYSVGSIAQLMGQSVESPSLRVIFRGSDAEVESGAIGVDISSGLKGVHTSAFAETTRLHPRGSQQLLAELAEHVTAQDQAEFHDIDPAHAVGTLGRILSALRTGSQNYSRADLELCRIAQIHIQGLLIHPEQLAAPATVHRPTHSGAQQTIEYIEQLRDEYAASLTTPLGPRVQAAGDMTLSELYSVAIIPAIFGTTQPPLISFQQRSATPYPNNVGIGTDSGLELRGAAGFKALLQLLPDESKRAALLPLADYFEKVESGQFENEEQRRLLAGAGSLQQLYRGIQLMLRDNNYNLRLAMRHLNGIFRQYEGTQRAIAAYADPQHTRILADGKLAVISGSQSLVIHALQRHPFVVYDCGNGIIGVKRQNGIGVHLGNLLSGLLRVDENWFAHEHGFTFSWGSHKAPAASNCPMTVNELAGYVFRRLKETGIVESESNDKPTAL